MILQKSNHKVKELSIFRWITIIILNGESEDISLITIDMMLIRGWKNFFFIMFQLLRKIEKLKNGCDTYAASFHEIKLHLAEAL